MSMDIIENDHMEEETPIELSEMYYLKSFIQCL